MRHRPNALMFFAAGFGTRMGALTQSTPKPMLIVDGKPLIDHSLDLAMDCGFKTMVANLHYLPDVLEDHLVARSVKTLRESPNILETGGGLRNALPLLGDAPVVTSNTDAVWRGPNPFQILLDAWNPDTMDALLLCTPLDRCHGQTGKGDFLISENGQLARGHGGHVYGGVQIMKTERLNDIEDTAFSLNLVWNQMLSTERLFGVAYPGHWCDVGRPEGINLAETLLRADHV